MVQPVANSVAGSDSENVESIPSLSLSRDQVQKLLAILDGQQMTDKSISMVSPPSLVNMTGPVIMDEIGLAEIKNGIYYLCQSYFPALVSASPQATINANNLACVISTKTWHHRLGHIDVHSFPSLSSLVFEKLNSSYDPCFSYHKAKQK